MAHIGRGDDQSHINKSNGLSINRVNRPKLYGSKADTILVSSLRKMMHILKLMQDMSMRVSEA